jgi:hypothetical protein
MLTAIYRGYNEDIPWIYRQVGHAAGVCSSCALCGLGADTGALISEAFGVRGMGYTL